MFIIPYASLAFEITLFNVDSNSSLLTSEKSSKNNIQCWDIDQGRAQDLNLLLKNIISSKISSLVIQFNYSFFNLDSFANFLDQLAESNIIIILFMHSTIDPPTQKDKTLKKISTS